MEYVVFQDTRLPFYVEQNLRTLDRIQLREHALLLSRTLGGRVVGPVPDLHEDLLDWVIRVQRNHLDPLRGSKGDSGLGDLPRRAGSAAMAAAQASMDAFEAMQEENRALTRRVSLLEDQVQELLAEKRAERAALDYVLFEGARLPLFVEGHLRTWDRVRLREHAQLLYRSLGGRIGAPVPEMDGDLADWILQVQARHLEPLKTSTTYRDAYGDTVKTSTSTDIFGDRKTTREVRDAFGDSKKTTTFSDPYGNKVTNKTSTDMFGNRKTSTTVRDAFGDTYKTSSFDVPADCVLFEGTRLPVFVEGHLRALDRMRLREHAQLLYRSLGGRIAEPDFDGDLVDWILQVQGRHLDPLRTPAERAWAHDYVLFEGARLPLFVEDRLRTWDRIRLREHAQLLYRSLGGRIGIPIPEAEGDLLDWVLHVQARHLEPLKTPAEQALEDYVHFEGSRLPLFREIHLRTWDRIRLREHAQLLYRSLGGRVPEPDYDGDLMDWVLQVQARHLEPLRTPAERALDYVLFEGTRLPLLVEGHLRTWDRIRLREHAQLLYRSLGGRVPEPDYDGNLADWILQVQSRHLEPLKMSSSYVAANGDVVKSTTMADPYGDTVTKRTSTDIFGDKRTTTTSRDALGDTTRTSTFSDPYGDKVTTKTSTDIFGDRKTTRETRDMFGDKTKSTTWTDPYGDKTTTRSSTNMFGDKNTTTTSRNALGESTKTSTFSDPYGDKVTTRTSTDIFGDRKTTRETRDMFGDRTKTTTTTDPYGDKVTTRSATDMFGDKTESTTVTDPYGDKLKTTTASDAFGNRLTTSAYSEPLSRLGGGVSPIRSRLLR